MNSQKKILMLIGQFHPAIGGAERECQNLSAKLIASGHQVSVLTGWAEGLAPFELIDGIPVFRKIRGWHLFEVTYMLSVLLFLWRHRRDFNHIICFGLYLYTVPAVLFALCTGKKVFLRIEGSGASGDFCRVSRLQYHRLIVWFAKRAHRILAISGDIRRELLCKGFSERKIIRISNSVDTDRFVPCADKQIANPPRICCIGRLSREKGIDVLLHALDILRRQGRPFQACIVGDGPLKQELAALAETLSLAALIDFAGPQQDTAPFYRQADILVLPSRQEGLPLVLLEGMASGLGIVAASVGGVPEAVNPGGEGCRAADASILCANGILVRPEDAAALASALLTLSGDHAVIKQLGKNARKHIEERYALASTVQHYLDLMDDS